jgi:hypothetical protein
MSRDSARSARGILAVKDGRKPVPVRYAIHLQLSNSLLEGVNASIRLIRRRAHGYANLANLIEMIHLGHGGIITKLPTETR